MMSTHTKSEKTSTALNFRVVDDKFTADDVLNAYYEGKESIKKEVREIVNNGIQLSSMSSNYLYEKLKNENIHVDNMYLRLVNMKEFDTLVVISDADYYNKAKRWSAYEYARQICEGIDALTLNFCFMPNSEEVDNDLIASEGYVFKYDKKEE